MTKDDLIYCIKYEFPKKILLQEFENASADKKSLDTYKHTNTFTTSDTKVENFFYVIPKTDICNNIAKQFFELYKINYPFYCMFFYMKRNGYIPFHIDKHNCVCTINVNLNKENKDPVEFYDGKFFYDIALINTLQPHRINSSTSDRILFRMIFYSNNKSFHFSFNDIKNLLYVYDSKNL
jgi:hypothetical protein